VFLVGSRAYRVWISMVVVMRPQQVPERYKEITKGWEGYIYGIRCITPEKYDEIQAAKRELKLA